MTGFFISESMNKLTFIQSTNFVSCFLVIESLYHKLQGISFGTIKLCLRFIRTLLCYFKRYGNFYDCSCKIREGDTSYLNNAVWINWVDGLIQFTKIFDWSKLHYLNIVSQGRRVGVLGVIWSGSWITDTHKTFESRKNTVISCLVTPLWVGSQR